MKTRIKIKRNESKVEGGRLYWYEPHVQLACKILTPAGMKLFFYLLGSEKTDIELDRREVCESLSLSLKSVYNGLKDLEESGYLIKSKEEYLFYESPQEEE